MPIHNQLLGNISHVCMDALTRQFEEVAMLSEKCTAVRQYLNEEAKRKHGFGGPKLSWSERMKDEPKNKS